MHGILVDMHRRALFMPLLASLACGGPRSQGVPVPDAPEVPSAAPVSAVPTTPAPPEVAAMLAEISPQQLNSLKRRRAVAPRHVDHLAAILVQAGSSLRSQALR